MSTIALIHPGCTDFDDQERIQGTLDLPLNERGEQQVQAIVEQLRNVPLEAIYTSTDDPARSTALAIGEALGVPVKELENLRNLDQGLWQGLQIDDVRRKYPKVFKQFKESPESISPPQGELVSDALQRLQKALAKPLKKKGALGIVASEPLATLIRCLIRHERPVLLELVGGGCNGRRIEILHINGTNGNTSK